VGTMGVVPKDQMWLFGMTLNIFGSVTVNFGTNLMKSAHNLFEESEGDMDECGSGNDSVQNSGGKSNKTNKTKDSMFNSRNIWALGLTIFSVGCLVNFASFAFAAQSLLAALGTVQFVSNVFFAKFVLGEVLTVRIVVATCIIVSGLLLAILFSNHASDTYTSTDLLELYTPGYFLFLVLLVIVLIICHSIYLVYTHNEEAGTPLQGINFFCSLRVYIFLLHKSLLYYSKPLCKSYIDAFISTVLPTWLTIVNI
jgi:hypothetical protein